LLFGTAFRPPNAYELYYESPGSQDDNPDLDPERIRTLEAVYERYSQDRRWRAGASAYWNTIEDLIVLGTDPLDGELVHENVAEVRGLGLELELEHSLENGARFVLGHTWQRTEDVATHERLVNSPEHATVLRSEWPLFERAATLGLALHAMDQRRTLAGETGGFARLDATLTSRQLAPGLTLSFGVANVFDREYADPVGEELVQDALEQDGRTWRLALAWRP
jgi:iron complex outermembrane receptor protein